MANGTIHKLGTLYMGSTKITRPTKPWRNNDEPYAGAGNGNIQNYSAGATLEIRDTESNDADKMQWVEVNDGGQKYLVCDRVMLVNISWDDLNAQDLIFGKVITIDGQQYRIRSLTGGSSARNGDNYAGGSPADNEWDKWIVNEAGLEGLPTPTSADLGTNAYQNESVMNGTHNQLWNWGYVRSWAQETSDSNSSYRANRGYGSARGWYSNPATNRNALCGWRPVLEVLNSAPVISGEDADLGEASSPIEISYSVDDEDASDVLTVTEKIDGTTIRTIHDAVRNQNYQVDLNSIWATIELGEHTVTITADDGNGAIATRTYTFTKTDDRIIFYGKNPIQTSIAAKEVVVSGIVHVAPGASLKIEACNNAFDDHPTWEDVTQAFHNKEAHYFSNNTKTATNWGVNYRVELLKNSATEKSYIEAIGINFGMTGE